MAQFHDVPISGLPLDANYFYDATNDIVNCIDDECPELFSSQNMQASDFSFNSLDFTSQTPSMSSVGFPKAGGFEIARSNSTSTASLPGAASAFSPLFTNLGKEYPTWDDQIWDQFMSSDLRSYGASMDGTGLQFPSLGQGNQMKAALSQPYHAGSSISSNEPTLSSSTPFTHPGDMSRSPTADESLVGTSSVPNLSPASQSSQLSSPSKCALTPDAYAPDREDSFAPETAAKAYQPSIEATTQQMKDEPWIAYSFNRKRKKSLAADADSNNPEDGSPNIVAPTKAPKRTKKAAHNTVEKRYRQNLNSKIAELRDSIPTLRTGKSSNDDEDGSESESNVISNQNPRKGQILTHAIEYIRQLKGETEQLRRKNEALRQKMAHLRTLTDEAVSEEAGSVESNPLKPSEISGPSTVHQRGFTPAMNPPSQQASSPSRGNSNRKGARLGNVLMGSLAGLTVFEGIREQEQSGATTSGRGLFALPLQWLDYIATTQTHVRLLGLGTFDTSIMNLVRLAILFGIVYGVLSSWILSDRGENPQKGKTATSGSGPGVLPPSSPLAVRQKAWLTSIQTVWVPQRNLILEVFAVVLKLFKLTLRWLVGWQGYAFLTGTTKEHEDNRVKAWDIAIDAQLAGGDSEICNDRILLTFLASMTLPATPFRIALKALHLQLLFWRLENNSWLQLFGAKELVMSLTCYLWDNARCRQHSIERANSTSGSPEPDALPNHLSLLLEQSCADVFADDVMRRALNFAWNRPSGEGSSFDDMGMDSVANDPAVVSPLDVLAALWSSWILRGAILRWIQRMGDKPCQERSKALCNDLSLAAQIAPPGSNARVRAMVALAVFEEKDRRANIATAMQAMEPGLPFAKSSRHASFDTPAGSPDIRVALRCALLNATIRNQSPSSTSELGRLQAQKLLQSVVAIVENSKVELLGFAAACSSLEILYHSPDEDFLRLREDVEELAAVFRVFVGGEARRRWGLERERASRTVTMCLEVCKRAAGV